MKKEEVLKFYLTYRLYIFPAVVALSALILIGFVIYPQVIKLISNQSVEKENLKKLDFLEAKAQELESYDQEDLNLKVNYTLDSYPIDRDFVTVTGLLQDLTIRSGFNIISLSLGSSAQASANTQSYNIKIEILGPTSQLSTLLSNIENSSRLMRVNNVETTVARDAQSSTVSIVIDVLYSPAPGDFGSIDSPLPGLSQKDEEILAKLAKVAIPAQQQAQTSSQSTPTGKANPFE